MCLIVESLVLPASLYLGWVLVALTNCLKVVFVTHDTVVIHALSCMYIDKSQKVEKCLYYFK